MANTPDQNQDPISLAWNKSRQLRDELAANAGTPDELRDKNLEVSPVDVGKQLAGSGTSAIGQGIKNFDVSSPVKAIEEVQKGGMLSDAINWAGGKLADTFLEPETATKAKAGLAFATGIAQGANVNGSDEQLNKTVNKAAETADKVVKPIAETVGGGIQKVGDAIKDTVSDQGKEALTKQYFTENAQGDLQMGNAWTTDPAVWAMKMADVIGSSAGMLAVGGVVQGGAKKMVMASMLKRGAPAAYAEKVAQLTAERLGQQAVMGSGMMMSVGQSADQTRDAVNQLSYEELMNSDTFKRNVQLVNDDPANKDLLSTQRLELARQRTANEAADAAKSDPTTYAAGVAGTLGDSMLFKMIGSKEGAFAGNALARAGKGFVKGGLGESVGEGLENGAQTNIQNRAENQVAGTNIDPMQGVAQSTAEGALLGFLSGGPTGALGSAIHKAKNNSVSNSQDENTSPIQPENVPDISAARQEIDSAQKTPGSFSIGKSGDGYQAVFVDGAGQVNETPVFATAEEAQQAVTGNANAVRQDVSPQPQNDAQASQQPDDLANIPAFMRNGQELSPELEQARNQAMNNAWQDAQAQQAKTEPGVMQPREKTVTGNPDEPAFLRTQQNNPTGRDTSTLQDADPYTQAQAALAKGGAPTADDLIQQSIQNGNQGKTPQEAGLTGDLLLAKQQPGVPATTEQSSGATVDGQTNEVIPESRGLGYSGTINMPGQPGNGINDSYVPPVTQSRQTADKSLDTESTRDPRSPVAQSIESSGQSTDAIFNELKTVRVTKKGKPFSSQKEAQLASRQTETPIELPTGGFGVVDKTDLERAQRKVGSEVPPNFGGNPQALAGKYGDGVINLAAYNITNADPLNKNDSPLSVEDAQFELDVMQDRANKGKLTPESFTQSGIASRLDTSQIKSFNDQIKSGDYSFIKALKGRISNQSAATPSPETVTDPVVAKESQPQPAMTQEEKEDSDIKAFTDTGKSDIPDSNYIGQAVGLLRMSEGLNHLPGNRSRVINAMANSLTSPAAKDYLIKLVKVYGFDAGFIQEDSKAVIQANTKPKENKKSPEQTQTNPDLADKSLEDLISLRNQTKAEHQNRADAISANAKLYPDDVNEARELEALNQRYSDKFNQIDSAIAKKRAESASDPAQTTPDNQQIIEHTTGKNKIIRGVVRKDLTVDEAKTIDPYTFKKDGGYFIREKHLDKLQASENAAQPEGAPVTQADEEGFVPRDNWESNLQAAREYANHLRKTGQISEESALKAWKKLESLVGLITKATAPAGKTVDFSKAKTVKAQLDMWDSLEAGDRVIDVKGIDRGTVFSKLKSQRIVQLTNQLNERDGFSISAITGGGSDIVAQLEARHAVNNTQQPASTDGEMTLDQLKQLRIDTINKLAQQEAGNHSTDDRLQRKKDQLDRAIAEAEPKPEPKDELAKDQFADNKLFTADRVAAARARLKSKIGNLNSGLDPEIMIDGMTIAGAYIESGVRSFTAYAKAMTDDFGDSIKPFLLSFWEGARHYPGLDTEGMTSTEESAKQHASLMNQKAETKAKPEADNNAGTERQILRDGIHSKMANGELISNNNTLKRVAAELLGISTGDLSTLQLKEAQEAYEVAAVRHRRDTIISTFNEGGSVKVAFDLAVSDYEAQPNLDVRTAKSSDMQAYSTPTPMALLANIAADVWSGKTVFEPTAGNGLLLLTADSKTTYANELDTDRADSLAWSGFNVTVQDATNNPLEGMIPAKVDAVVANPPFGKYRDDNGKPARVEFEDNQGRAYSFGEIDHIIAKNALDGMKDDGKATLILGAPKEAGDYTGNNKVFLNWLYSNYNVVHHIEADGSLFKGQGAGWPTQMIVIDGRAKDGTGKFAPFKGEINRLDSWGKVYDSFNEAGLLDTKGAVFSETAGNGKLSEGYQPDTDTAASQRSDNQRSGGNGGRTGVSRSGKSGRTAGNGGRKQSGNSGSPDGTFDSQPDISGRELEPTESRSTTDAGNTEPDKRSDRVGLSGQRNGDAVTDYQKKEISSAITKVNDFQAEYKTASEGFNDGVLTPVNMASYTQTALASIQDRHGSIDKFVADRLGYKSKSELQKAFMGLQADAVALAVDAIEKGRAIIIGDQTGVGKGRQAAGVIRYALEQNKTPIFVTQKPNLFTDMYDDLADIGVKNFKPLIVNQENGFISKGDKTLFNMGTKERQTALNHILKTGQLPDGHNALFLTYSQISSDKNGNKVSLISKLAENAVMVMDESHTAAGQDSKLGLAFQELVNNVHGLVYLSATYAKRPDNMLLYTRTDLGQAVDNREALVSIISNGGLGMQTYIAGKLAEAGQMVRRERSFDGIEIKNRIIDDKDGDIKRGFDQATTALRAIQDLSAAWRNYVEDVLAKKIQKESGMDTRIAGNQADTKVNVTLFSSIVHNYIAQLSLGLKAKETAKLAIEAIGRGERPVIALENTMGSALDDYMVRTGRRIGDSASDLTYSSLLKSVADGSLAYLVKEAGSKKGEKSYVNIKDVYDPLIQSLYSQVMDAADAMNMDIPASPIDAIRHEIEKAGYTVAEITGRELMVDYANGSEIKKRPADEKNRRRIVDNFNSKKLDVLILNQAGSTGLSIHASEKFADQSPRHMIVAQPSLDINTFLQMLGRVNRTGQVALPSYSLAWLDLPSEKRPAAVLSRKMSSLNANTSGNADSATSIDAVDILNPYGDQVVTSFVEANRELLEQYNPRLVNLPQGDEATYFLGKLAVLPSDVAEQVIGQIEKDYNDLISYLDATGQNELNTKEVDLDAQPVSQRVVSEGRKNAGVFSEPTYATKVDVKAQGKAPKWDEVESALKESSQADFDEAINRMKADNGFANRLQERLKKAQSELDIRKVEGKSTKSEVEKVESIKQLISSHEAEKNNLEYLFSPRGTYHHGAVLRVRLPDSEESVTGILTGLNFENDGGNPAAKSKWRMKIMVADRVRQLPINLSQAESGVIEGGRQDNRYNLQAIFDRAAAMPSREHRYIMTGNLVEAQNRSTEKGRIIPFTTADGRVIQGMLMPKKFDPAAGSMKEEAKVTSTQAFNWLTNTEDKTAASLGLRTPDGDVVLRRLYNGGYELELPKAVSKGKKYWGNPSMVDIIGEQAVKGNGKLNIRLSIEEAKAVNKVMSNINPMTITNQAQIADYNRMTGKKVPTFSDKNIKFSKVPMNAAEQAGKGMKPGEAHLAAKEWLRQFKTDVQVKVAKDQAEFDQLMTEAGQGGTLNADEIANAAYLPESKTLLLNASAIQNPARLRQLMRHEILGHHGLEYVIGKGAVNDILQILKNGYATSKAIRDAVDTVAANYADADVKTKIKEAFAHYAENRPVDQGPLGRLWDRVVSAVKSALVKAGFIRANEAEKQLDSILKTIAENMRNGKEQQSAILVKNKAEFSLNVNKEPIPPEVGYQSWDLIDENSDYYDGEDYALIEKIYVRPQYRRKGYARKLVREAIAEIQSENPGLPIRLAADPQNAVGAEKIYSDDLVRFYETEGFEVIDTSGDMPFVVMEYRGSPQAKGKAYFSKGKNGDTSAYGQAGSLLKESGSSLVNWLKQQRGRGLGTLTDLQIDQIYRDITGGAVNRYQKLRTKMESDRNDILLEAETKYDPMWEAMPEKEKAALSRLMHDATMSRLHPDKSLEENSLYQEVKDKLAKARTEKTKAEYQAELDIIRDNYRNLSERYRLSSKQSKELYATMRDLYSAQWEKLRDAISQRIEDQMGEGGKALASQMRLRMEQALRHGPYFPLARFGDYVVKARKDGEYIREHFEKRKDAEAALNQYRRDGYKAVMTVKETSAGDQANAHALGMEVIEALDKAQAEGTAPAELKDTVWQAMLDMLPDSSYAKHAIHRKRIKGASRDGHRAYLQSVYHFAHHVSKIRYGHQMKAELDGMKEQVQLAVQGEESNIKPDEAEIAQQVLNEMNLRHEMNMNPKGSALAGQLGNLGFMFYLGASPASAMVNLTQNVTVMLPQLAGKYGFVKAAKFMLQAMVDYMRHGVFQKGTKEAWVSLTRATNAAITADEKAMLNKLYKAGVLDLTQAHSIAARADTDQQNIKPGKQWARTGMRWAGALFHNAEVLNREVAALTAYRLMKAQQPGIASDVLKGDSAAIDQVAEMVYDGHGNYAASNRPRYMRSDVMKVLTQFKIYSQMMTYTLARNAVLAAKGDKTALKTLGVMFGTTWMMAGMMGMPTPVGLILYGLASLFDDDDDRTGEASFRLGLTEVFGAEVGELIAKGPVDAISGLNISGRTGLSDLWWRSPKEGTEGDDLTFHYVQQIAGPVLGIGVSAVRGMREFANGDIQRGVEAMSPKAVKDLAKAYRQATEGEQTRNGDSVIDDVGAWNVAMQAMGFSSAKMSQVYAARGYIKGKEKVIEDERSNLLADFFDAKRSGDEEAMRDVMERIKAFNSKHDRAETITGRTLMQSIKSRNRSMERTQAGVYLSKKREYLRGEGAFLDDEDDDE